MNLANATRYMYSCNCITKCQNVRLDFFNYNDVSIPALQLSARPSARLPYARPLAGSSTCPTSPLTRPSDVHLQKNMKCLNLEA